MSTALFSPANRRNPMAHRALALLLILFAVPALATSTDRNQQIKVHADHFSTAQKNGTTVLRGHVSITQGTLMAEADKATAHRDARGDFSRIVLEGQPATMRQTLDGGASMRGRASTIDYGINDNTVILTGAAHVERSDQGSFDGAKLVYNTDTGAIEGTGGANGQVELTLKPRHGSKP